MSAELSIIIPVYNAGQYIGECLDSLIRQSLKSIEIICVDDGSTDSSRQIIEEYIAKDPRIKLYCQKNQHAGIARNTGLSHAEGEYVHFLDADDYVLDYAYESVLQEIRKHQADCIKFCAIAYDETLKESVHNDMYKMAELSPHDFNRILGKEEGSKIFRLCVTPWTGIYRRAFLEENEIRFNNLYCVNDRSFFAHVIAAADRVVAVRDRVVVHRVNMAGSLIGGRAAHFDCQLESIRLIEKTLLSLKADRIVFETIMDNEFRDLLYWCEKFSRSPEYGKSILEQTDHFVDEFDYEFMAPFRKHMDQILRRAETGDISSSVLTQNTITEKVFFEAPDAPGHSVLLPLYIKEETLHELMCGLLPTLPEDAELICVDFGISDKVPLILREYAAVDGRVRAAEEKAADFNSFLEIGTRLACGTEFCILPPSIPAKFEAGKQTWYTKDEISGDRILKDYVANLDLTRMELYHQYFREKDGKKKLQEMVDDNSMAQSEAERARLQEKLRNAWAERDELRAKLQKSYEEKSEINAKLQQTYEEKSEINAKLQQAYAEKSEINAKLQQTYEEKSEINAKLQQAYEEKSEINAKLQQTYEEKSEINAKLQQTYEEKSEINAKLKQTFAEKSGLNAKLQQTYKEKSALNAKLTQQKAESDALRKELKEIKESTAWKLVMKNRELRDKVTFWK